MNSIKKWKIKYMKTSPFLLFLYDFKKMYLITVMPTSCFIC